MGLFDSMMPTEDGPYPNRTDGMAWVQPPGENIGQASGGTPSPETEAQVAKEANEKLQASLVYVGDDENETTNDDRVNILGAGLLSTKAGLEMVPKLTQVGKLGYETVMGEVPTPPTGPATPMNEAIKSAQAIGGSKAIRTMMESPDEILKAADISDGAKAYDKVMSELKDLEIDVPKKFMDLDQSEKSAFLVDLGMNMMISAATGTSGDTSGIGAFAVGYKMTRDARIAKAQAEYDRKHGILEKEADRLNKQNIETTKHKRGMEQEAFKQGEQTKRTGMSQAGSDRRAAMTREEGRLDRKSRDYNSAQNRALEIQKLEKREAKGTLTSKQKEDLADKRSSRVDEAYATGIDKYGSRLRNELTALKEQLEKSDYSEEEKQKYLTAFEKSAKERISESIRMARELEYKNI